MQEPTESYLENTECGMQSIARTLVLHMFEAEVNTQDVDEILNMLEIHWAAARMLGQVPDVDVYDAFDKPTVEHLVQHVLYEGRVLN